MFVYDFISELKFSVSL